MGIMRAPTPRSSRRDPLRYANRTPAAVRTGALALVVLFAAPLSPATVAVADRSADEAAQAANGSRDEVRDAVTAYLLCLDFDCVAALDAVVVLGADAGPLLLHLLEDPDATGVPALRDAGVNRSRVIEALVRIGDPASAPAIRRALSDPEATVRATAAGGIARLEGRRSLPWLRPLLADESSFVRESAARAVGAVGGAAAEAALAEALRSESDPYVRTVLRDLLDGD